MSVLNDVEIHDCLVSIVVPVYNVQDYLRECLESLVNQTFHNIEIIIVDDGSTDDSAIIIQEYVKKYSYIRTIRQLNKGQGSARNAGLRLAAGKYVYFCDSDDYVDIDTIKVCVHNAEKFDVDLVIFQADIFDDYGEKEDNVYHFFEKLENSNDQICRGIYFFKKYYNTIPFLNIPMMLIRKEFLISNKIETIEIRKYEDMDFFYQVICYDPKMVFLNKNLYHRRNRDNSTTSIPFGIIDVECYVKVYSEIMNYAVNGLEELYTLISVKKIYEAVQIASKIKYMIPDELIKLVIRAFLSYCEGCFKNDLKLCLSAYYCFRYVDDQLRLGLFNPFFNTLKKQIKNYIDDSCLMIPDKKVGIYGTGIYAKRILDCVEELFGKPKAEIIYIDSKIQSDSKEFKGCKIKNIADVNLNDINVILIISKKYENEIYNGLPDAMKEITIRTLDYINAK